MQLSPRRAEATLVARLVHPRLNDLGYAGEIQRANCFLPAARLCFGVPMLPERMGDGLIAGGVLEATNVDANNL